MNTDSYAPARSVIPLVQHAQDENEVNAGSVSAVSAATNLRPTSLKWGMLEGIDDIRSALEKAHLKISTWRLNMFSMPHNAIGKEAVKELTRLLTLFNNSTCWEPVAVHFVMVFLPLMLQKPSSR